MQTNNSEYGGADLAFAPLCCLYTDNIMLSTLAFYRNYGIITSDFKSAEADFAVQKHAAHRTSENILPLNLLSDDKIRRTAVSVYTDLIYGIMNTETAGNLDFSWLPAFFVTNLLLVQCSI